MAIAGDGFDDEYFADLLNEDLEQLERVAIQSTQAPTTTAPSFTQRGNTERQQVQAQPEVHINQADLEPDFYEEGGDEVIDTAHIGYTQVPVAPGGVLNTRLGGATSGYISARSTAQTIHRPHLDATQRPVQYDIPYRPSSQSQELAGHDAALQTKGYEGTSLNYSNVDLRSLQAQVRELLQDRERLQQAVHDANNQVYSKSGEIAIVRANNERITREKEKKIAELEKQLKEAGDQRTVELEQAKKQQEKLATENRFADHDRVIERARGRKQPNQQNQQWPDQDVVISGIKSRPATTHLSTPKKSRQFVSVAGAGDGFDTADRNVVPSSPLSRDGTPKVGEKKRKRPLTSPVHLDLQRDDAEMELSQSFVFNDDDDDDDDDDDEHDELVASRRPSTAPYSSPDSCYQILQDFLDRRYNWGKQRTVEALAGFSFPSDDSTPISSLIYNAVSKLNNSQPSDDFAAALCSLVIQLWQRCITEKYFGPVRCLVDYVTNFLFEYPDISSLVMDELVPLAQTTCDVNIIPRFKHLRRAAAGKASSSTTDLLSSMSSDVSVADSLNLLVTLSASLDEREASSFTRFWRLVRFDFVSMLLRPTQDPDDVALLANLLGTGACIDSIGSVIDASHAVGGSSHRSALNQIDQAKSEEHILDRLSSMLIETLKPVGEDFEQFDDETVTNMRLAILGCLSTYAARPRLASTLVRHPLVIGRLVLCLADGFHSAMMSSPNAGGETLRAHLEVVGEAIRLVFHLVNAYRDEFDFTEKLLKIRGGPQRCLVVLSRLVFSEGMLFDIEIDEDIIDCAQALLEDFVSPEEGEMLMEMAGEEN